MCPPRLAFAYRNAFLTTRYTFLALRPSFNSYSSVSRTFYNLMRIVRAGISVGSSAHTSNLSTIFSLVSLQIPKLVQGDFFTSPVPREGEDVVDISESEDEFEVFNQDLSSEVPIFDLVPSPVPTSDEMRIQRKPRSSLLDLIESQLGRDALAKATQTKPPSVPPAALSTQTLGLQPTDLKRKREAKGKEPVDAGKAHSTQEDEALRVAKQPRMGQRDIERRSSPSTTPEAGHRSNTKMVEKELIENSNTKQLRQPPSVPFLWEVRPGIPKRDWKPEASSVKPVPKPPVKLVASVPFLWEEKPGKPLPSFSQPPQDSAPLTPPANLISFPSPSVYSHSYTDDSFEADVETFGFETDDTFSSRPSLLANCLVSVTAISTAVPVEKISVEEYQSGELEAPSSPASETDSSASSYAIGTASLVGAPFLECLFPLLPPTSGFLNKVGCFENDCQAPLEPKSIHNDRQSNSSVLVRKAPTLGELIMMSRRRSLQRKAAQMRKQNLSMDLTKSSRAFGCCIFISGSKMMEGLHRKGMHLPRLKLM
ncbi:hypothetical protein SO802_032697 [Lithocarpus litseifolius]|uniref:Uncharacterized protein n=1 Tax=Lithocarpus litseifolius TaxID=425828 RepID=A0AAW2BBI5_9ROSI